MRRVWMPPLRFDGSRRNKLRTRRRTMARLIPAFFLAGAHLVVVQCHIETPMDAIFYSPMSSHHVSQCAGIGGHAADVEATLVARLAVDRAFRFDHPERSQIGPLLGSREAVQLGERPAAADLQSAMILLDRLGIGVTCSSIPRLVRWRRMSRSIPPASADCP